MRSLVRQAASLLERPRALHVLVLVSSAIFAALAIIVSLGTPWWDSQVILLTDLAFTRELVDRADRALVLGYTTAGILTAIAVGLMLLRRKWGLAIFWTVALGGAIVLVMGLKEAFHRAPLGTTEGYSFPSGNAVGSAALLTAIALSVPRRWLLPTLVFGIPVVIAYGVGIVYAGWHYVSDVVAGWCVGVAWVAGAWLVMKARLEPSAATDQEVARAGRLAVAVAACLGLLLTAGLAFSGSSPQDRRAPSRPTGLTQKSATKTTLRVAWRPSHDNVRVVGYVVSVNARLPRRVGGTSATVQKLHCGATYRIGVVAVDATKNRSPMATLRAKTRQCSVPSPVPPPPPPPPPPTRARTIFVSPSGSDGNPGTENSPFRTIQKAADVVNPGETVVVKPGVYRSQGCSSALVCITRSGTASAPITFRSEKPWEAKLDGQNSVANGFMFRNDAQYVRVEDFEIAHFVSRGSGSHGVEIYAGGSHSWIVGNHIFDIGRIQTNISNGQVGIFVEDDDVVIERNFIHDIGRTNDDDVSHDHGIYVDGNASGGLENILIRNNVFAAITHGWAVHVYPGDVEGVDILNNTFVGGNPERDYTHIVLANADVRDLTIRNNIFYSPTSGKTVRLRQADYSNVVISDNITTGSEITDSGAPAGVTIDRNMVSTAPLLRNASSLPYGLRLLPSSPARNRGATLSQVPDDFEGHKRPRESRHDMGAFEYGP